MTNRLPVRQSIASTAVNVLGVGSGGVQELCGYVDDASVSWALVRFQVGSASNARTKFVSVHCNGEDVPTVKRGRLNARTKEVIQMFGDVHANIEVRRKADITVDLLCEKLLTVFNSTDVGGSGTTLKGLKEEYEKMVSESLSAKASGANNLGADVAVQTAKDAGVTAKACLEAVGGTQGPWNWVLLEPTKLELHNGGYGGLEEMKQHLDVTKVLFGLIRFSFGKSEAACGTAFVPANVKHVFVHYVGNKVPVVRRGQWNAKQNEADKEVRTVCVPLFRKEAHSADDLTLEDMISEVKRLALSTQASEEESNIISVEECLKAWEAEKLERLSGGTSSSADDAEMPEADTAIETVRAVGGMWNWTLLTTGSAAPGAVPSQSAVKSTPVAPAKTPVAPEKDDSAEKAAAEKKAAEEAAAKAAAEKAAAEKAAAEKANAEKLAAEKVAAEKLAAEENAKKLELDKAATEKAAFDAAVARAVEEKMAVERKSLAAQQIQETVTPQKAAPKRSGSRSWDRLCGDEDVPDMVAAAKESASFSVGKPIPDTYLGAFETTAETGVEQLGWFSSSMPPEEVIVVQVEDGSWASKIGLKAGDELMELQGKEVSEIEQKEFISFMHQRPLVLSFYRQENAREKMLQRGSLPTGGRGSTPLRPSVVNKLNSTEDVRHSVVVRQNNEVNIQARTSQVVQSFPDWEDFCGELHIRSGWAWKRRFFQLAKGHLRWWQKKEQFMKSPRPDPEVDLGLVEAMSRWKVEGLKGSRFELNYHNIFKQKQKEEEKKAAAKDGEGGEEKKERKSLLKRASGVLHRKSTRERSSSVSSRKSSAGAPTGSGSDADPEGGGTGPKHEKYLVAADDIQSATEWARAIWHHIAYVDMLTLWPMPLEGRQGDISFYGIDPP